MKNILRLSWVATLLISSLCFADWEGDGLKALSRNEFQNAVRHFTDGMLHQDSKSMYQLLILVTENRLPRSFFTSDIVSRYRASAESRDPLGQNTFGFMNQQGVGVQANRSLQVV